MAATKSKASGAKFKSSAKGGATAKAPGERCWKGFEPVPGKKPFSKGSCRKK